MWCWRARAGGSGIAWYRNGGGSPPTWTFSSITDSGTRFVAYPTFITLVDLNQDGFLDVVFVGEHWLSDSDLLEVCQCKAMIPESKGGVQVVARCLCASTRCQRKLRRVVPEWRWAVPNLDPDPDFYLLHWAQDGGCEGVRAPLTFAPGPATIIMGHWRRTWERGADFSGLSWPVRNSRVSNGHTTLL
jgi:hypothetical protein